jgi:F-type H+-transporting ATPase subunit epsilon
MDNVLIKFELVTPERIVLKEVVTQATLPTELGEITVLPNHIPLVASLKPGVIEVKLPDHSSEIIAVSGGFVEVLKNSIVILADTAEKAGELDEERIEQARAAAEALKLAANSAEAINFADISARLEKELARSHAVKRWKKYKQLKTED